MDPGHERLRDELLDKNQYPEYIRRFQRNRKQRHDRRGQLHSVTHNHKLGEKLPLAAKFPFISHKYEEMDEKHGHSKHRLGMLNGLYLVPEHPSGPFILPSVKVGNYDPLPEFWESARFKLLDHAFNLVYVKLQTFPFVAIAQGDTKDLTLDEKLNDYSK